MGGIKDEEVCCCFCGRWLSAQTAVRMEVSTVEMGDESQVLFAHKACLSEKIHSSVPLHPDLLE
jgi:hypothetical protein